MFTEPFENCYLSTQNLFKTPQKVLTAQIFYKYSLKFNEWKCDAQPFVGFCDESQKTNLIKFTPMRFWGQTLNSNMPLGSK